MSLFGRIMESMRLSDGDDDDYFLDDDYEEEEERPPRKSLFGKRDRDDDYYDEDDDEEESPRPRSFLGRSSNSNSNKVVPMKRNMEVAMVIPTSFGDSKEICDHLLAGKTVVLNMEGLHTEIAQRIIDFASGAVCRRSPTTFLSLPLTRWISPEIFRTSLAMWARRLAAALLTCRG